MYTKPYSGNGAPLGSLSVALDLWRDNLAPVQRDAMPRSAAERSQQHGHPNGVYPHLPGVILPPAFLGTSPATGGKNSPIEDLTVSGRGQQHFESKLSRAKQRHSGLTESHDAG